MDNYLQRLAADGKIGEGAIIAATEYNGGSAALVVDGVTVTLYSENEKVFSDTTDRLSDISVKSGLFKKTVGFTHNGSRYELAVKGGKNLIDYFKLLISD